MLEKGHCAIVPWGLPRIRRQSCIGAFLPLLVILVAGIASCVGEPSRKEYLYLGNRVQFSAFHKISDIASATGALKIMRKKRGYVPRLELTGFSVERGSLKMAFAMDQYVVLHEDKITICKNGGLTDYEGKIRYMIFEEAEVRIVISFQNKDDEHIFLPLPSDSTNRFSLIELSFEGSADYLGSKGTLYSLPNWY